MPYQVLSDKGIFQFDLHHHKDRSTVQAVEHGISLLIYPDEVQVYSLVNLAAWGAFVACKKDYD